MDKVRLTEPMYVQLRARGLRFVNGVASCYDETYPEVLERYGLNQAEFAVAIHRVNETVAMYWPCSACFCFGYVCSPCTLGLSFLGPSVCVSAAEQYLERELVNLNHSEPFQRARMTWRLKKRCLDSWIEIEVPEAV